MQESGGNDCEIVPVCYVIDVYSFTKIIVLQVTYDFVHFLILCFIKFHMWYSHIV